MPAKNKSLFPHASGSSLKLMSFEIFCLFFLLLANNLCKICLSLYLDNKPSLISTSSVCLLTVFSVTQHQQSNPFPTQNSYPGCLHRRSPRIKCVRGPAWSVRTNPPAQSQTMTAASLQTRMTSCTIDGREEGAKMRAIELTSIYNQITANSLLQHATRLAK